LGLDAGANKAMKVKRLYGQIMSAVGEKKYKACKENEYKISIQRFAGILAN
jgi:hypothetical protein